MNTDMAPFDIAPFALPNTPAGELRFEQPREIQRVTVTFTTKPPDDVGLSYLRQTWPARRPERIGDHDLASPAEYGWWPCDDQYHGQWRRAAAVIKQASPRSVDIRFDALKHDSTVEEPGYDSDDSYRRTLGLRLSVPDVAKIRKIAVFTRSEPAQSRLRVELHSPKPAAGKGLALQGYNAAIEKLTAIAGVTIHGLVVTPRSVKRRAFHVDVRHMHPAHRYANDSAHVTFDIGRDGVTIDLDALAADGPIWSPDFGLYIAKADDPTTLTDYRHRIASLKTVSQCVVEHAEQTYAGASKGQPRLHEAWFVLGCPLARQKFRVETHGDLTLRRWLVATVPATDTDRFAADEDIRWRFGLDQWLTVGRHADASGIPAANLHVRRGDLHLKQRAIAVPLLGPIVDDHAPPDRTIVALLRFRFENRGDKPLDAELPVSCCGPLATRDQGLFGDWKGEQVFRALYSTTMQPTADGPAVRFTQHLDPGQRCELLLKIPFIAIDRSEEIVAIDGLTFDAADRDVARYWKELTARGAQTRTPVPELNALHEAHTAHVAVADFAIGGDTDAIATSVGATTYGNFTNESAMIIHDLDQRGLHDEARRRLDAWIRYQGTVALSGNFTDHDGVLFGSGGYEQGHSYNQHHGSAMWAIAEHLFLSDDVAWFAGAADALMAAADWVTRQRGHAKAKQPHSRGWETGLLPAGGLEDVQEYAYWLSSNVLTWRGMDHAAKALAMVKHRQAKRIRCDADDYRRAIVRAFNIARRHTPLVRLRDGRWAPTYPSRPYCRGRDFGWIRQTLEGAIYLLIAGLIDPTTRQGKWILDDFQDNHYMTPPYGYALRDPSKQWFDCGGFSIQPNLLAGLIPHLMCDQPELYIWMFLNAWTACYMPAANTMVEHPLPTLGFHNNVPYKTSDQANAMMWLRAMFVWADDESLHLGRTIPRQWFGMGETLEATDVLTHFGKVSVRYEPHAGGDRVTAHLKLELRRRPRRILLRVRHANKKPIRAVQMDGRPHTVFDPIGGDVDLTGQPEPRDVIVAH